MDGTYMEQLYEEAAEYAGYAAAGAVSEEEADAIIRQYNEAAENAEEFVQVLQDNNLTEEAAAVKDMNAQLQELELTLEKMTEELSLMRAQMEKMHEDDRLRIVKHLELQIDMLKERLVLLKNYMAHLIKEMADSVMQAGKHVMTAAAAKSGVRSELAKVQEGVTHSLTKTEQTLSKIKSFGEGIREANRQAANTFRQAFGKEPVDYGSMQRSMTKTEVFSKPLQWKKEMLEGLEKELDKMIDSIDRFNEETVKKDGNAVMCVKDQTAGVCVEAVKQNGFALEYVKDQTLEVCLEAVKQNGNAIMCVKEQTPGICLEAVKQNGMVLTYVKEQTPEICLEAVKQNGRALWNVEKQTPEICLAAVKQDGWALKFVEKQTPEICLEAVKKNAWALKFVQEQTPEICLEAVKQNGWTLKLVQDQTAEVCLEALKSAPEYYRYIKDQGIKEACCSELIGQDISKNGFQPTDSLKKNMLLLSEKQGKVCTLSEVKHLAQNKSLSEEMKKAVGSITAECQAQEMARKAPAPKVPEPVA